MPPRLQVTVLNELNDITFSVLDVLRLPNLNSNKSPGPDNIHPRVLSECAEELAFPLYILFRKSLTEGKVPLAWKEGRVSPILQARVLKLIIIGR